MGPLEFITEKILDPLWKKILGKILLLILGFLILSAFIWIYMIPENTKYDILNKKNDNLFKGEKNKNSFIYFKKNGVRILKGDPEIKLSERRHPERVSVQIGYRWNESDRHWMKQILFFKDTHPDELNESEKELINGYFNDSKFQPKVVGSYNNQFFSPQVIRYEKETSNYNLEDEKSRETIVQHPQYEDFSK